MDNNNLIAAVILSIIIMVGFQYLYVRPQQEAARQQQLAQQMAKQNPAEAPMEAAPARPRAEVIAASPRVPIATPELRGSVNLKGARIDDLSLVKYHESADPNSPNIVLLSPAGSAPPNPAYYAEFSWLTDNKALPTPAADTLWKSDSPQLAPDHPLKLTWNNGQGLQFERTISVDDHFMFTVTDDVRNNGGAPVLLYPFGLITRQGKPPTRDIYILHEGPLGVLDGTLKEFKYKDLIEIGRRAFESIGGWLGITDKYWLVALVPDQKQKIDAEFAYNGDKNNTEQGHFQTDYRAAAVTLAPGSTLEHTERLFAGAKRLRVLDHYEDEYNIPLFDHAIDFGWFDFLTKPFLYLLDYLGRWFGNFGLAILVFTVLLKFITLPLSIKSYRSMAKMKTLQPEMKRVQERFKEDKVRQSQELMELYKREKVSPLSGCVPTLIQIPIFFALYKVLYVGIEMRQAPFFGWIKDLSIPDPTSVFNLFGLIHMDLPRALHIGVWPILMGISMFLQQRLSPQPPDKTQARVFMFMPIFMTYLLAQMPAGLVIYWTWSNLLSLAQQWYIAHKTTKT